MKDKTNLRKIVINKCFGGFGLSDEAFELFLTRKGIKFYKEPSFLTSKFSQDIPEKEWKKNLSFYDESLVKRDDPILVEIVEELGEKVNGFASDLKIIEIPEDISWYIHEYDGLESIHENHRSWS